MTPPTRPSQRAYRGEGATLIEAKMMRMKGHAIHDAALYVPKPMFEYWNRRDCILRMERYLLEKKWLTEAQNKDLIASVDKQLDDDRTFAENSPFPDPATVKDRVYCDNSIDIPLKYGQPKSARSTAMPSPKNPPRIPTTNDRAPATTHPRPLTELSS